METKKELRRRMSALKRALPEDEARRLSARIMDAVEACPAFEKADTVLLYYSLPDEVHTHDFVSRWGNRKRILLPVVIGDDLELRLYTGKDSLAPGPFGIDEPQGEPFDDYTAIGFVGVPGVAFSHSGARLGRGKGFYDRLLPKLTNAYKAGICYPFQLINEVPTEAFDICMDEIITANEQ